MTETTFFLVYGSQKLTYRRSNYRFLYFVTIFLNYSIVYANWLFRPILLYFRKHTVASVEKVTRWRAVFWRHYDSKYHNHMFFRILFSCSIARSIRSVGFQTPPLDSYSANDPLISGARLLLTLLFVWLEMPRYWMVRWYLTFAEMGLKKKKVKNETWIDSEWLWKRLWNESQ